MTDATEPTQPTQPEPTQPTRVQIAVEGGELPAYLWAPASGASDAPGIVLVQEIFGVSGYMRRRAQDLANAGYAVLVPVVFWRLGVEAVEDGPTMLDEGIGLVSTLDWPTAVADVTAAVAWLGEQPGVDGRVALVGFCFGGGLGYQVASGCEPAALVSFYGSALPGLVDTVPVVQAPSLHHFGSADAFIDPATVEHIREVVQTNPECEFHLYEGANHAFDNDDFVMYHAEASGLAWERTLEFLSRRLPVQS